MSPTIMPQLSTFILATVVALLALPSGYAQDVITMKDGTEIKAMVTEVGQAEVSYRKYENATGPVYTIKKSNVFMIRYQNGTKDVFTAHDNSTDAGRTPRLAVTDADIRRARRSATWGYILPAPILILGIAAATADSYDDGMVFGSAATIIAGAGIPLVAGGARRTRVNTGVEGNRGFRIAGWISYGVAIADAVYLLAISDEVDTSGAATPVAVLGAASSVFMALDAGRTAQQAEALKSGAHVSRFQPFLSSSRDANGKFHPTLGLRIRL